MSDSPDYIKDIEKYFLSLAGEGIMLSSMDYNLIRDWKKRGVPKELVLRGINRAFSDRGKTKNARAAGFPKGLRQCAEYVEQCVIDFGPGDPSARSSRGENIVPEGLVGEIAEKLGRMIDSEKNKVLRDYYTGLRLKILRLGESSENFLKTLSELEEESMDEFFNGLPEGEKEKIIHDAESMIKDRARHMTSGAYRASVISFRNEILGSKYGIKGVIP